MENTSSHFSAQTDATGKVWSICAEAEFIEKLIEIVVILNHTGNLTSHAGLRLCQRNSLRNYFIDWDLSTLKFVFSEK